MKHSSKSSARTARKTLTRSPAPLLELLESRLQPGSIVMIQGPGLSSLADGMARQEVGLLRSDSLASSENFRTASSITPAATASANLPAASSADSRNEPSALPTRGLVNDVAADGLNDDLSALLGSNLPGSGPLLATETPVVRMNPTRSAPASAGMIESPIGVATPPIVQANPITGKGAALRSIALTPKQLPMPTVTPIAASVPPANLQAVALNLQAAGNAGGISSFVTTQNFSTFVGGSGQDNLAGVAVDGAGNIYVAGSLEASPGTSTAFVASFDPTGSNLRWAVQVNDNGLSHQAHGIAVATDSSGHVNVYLTGSQSNGDPVTQTDGFVSVLDGGSGQLLNSIPFLNKDIEGIALDQNGNVFVSGTSIDPSSGVPSIWTAEMDSALDIPPTYSVLLNVQDANMQTGNSAALGSGSIAVDANDNVYILGTFAPRGSSDFSPIVVAYNNDPSKQFLWQPVSYANPVTPGPGFGGGIVYQNGSIYITTTLFDSTNENQMSGLNSDLLLAKLDATSGAQTYANQWLITDGMATLTRIGDWTGNGLIVNAAGEAIVVGAAFDPIGSAMFPATKGVDVHVTHFSADGTATQLTTGRPENTFGGSAVDVGNAIVADPTNANSAIVVGMTQSNDFPTTPNAFQQNYGGGPSDGFLASVQV